MTTLPFESFWAWLLQHPNCILRAGGGPTVIFDDDDFHWHFAADGATLFVQVIRGKRILGEIVIESERISYVQLLGEEREGEFAFELIGENETERLVLYHFILSHDYDEDDEFGAETRATKHSVH